MTVDEQSLANLGTPWTVNIEQECINTGQPRHSMDWKYRKRMYNHLANLGTPWTVNIEKECTITWPT